MLLSSNYVPNILLCGDEQEFFARVDKRPFKIVGHVKLFGVVDGQPLNFLQDDKLFFDGKIQPASELSKTLKGGSVDYLVFNDANECDALFNTLHYRDMHSPKIITLERFNTLPHEYFYDADAEGQLLLYLKQMGVKTVLDVDAYFAKGRLYSKLSNDITEIDCVSEESLVPIKENLYRHRYENFKAIGFIKYDGALICERSPEDFLAMFVFAGSFADCVITFARTDSPLEKFIINNVNSFGNVEGFQVNTGKWFFLTHVKPPEDFGMYVVTHKTTPHENKLPEGYQIIHAGRALSDDLGYPGDDTGDNISDLNIYINEITALYWMWKHTSHTIIGLCHYRRFFTEANDDSFSYDKILTQEDAAKVLSDYDIVVTPFISYKNQREFIEATCGKNLLTLGEMTLKKHLLRNQPAYLEAFDYVLSSTNFYKCNMFVTRREIFDAYCKWLFSFLIDATREVLATVNLESYPYTPRRLMSFLAERMFSVWLMKNRLRIKELSIMMVEDL